MGHPVFRVDQPTPIVNTHQRDNPLSGWIEELLSLNVNKVLCGGKSLISPNVDQSAWDFDVIGIRDERKI